MILWKKEPETKLLQPMITIALSLDQGWGKYSFYFPAFCSI